MPSSPILLPISTRSVGFTVRVLIRRSRNMLGSKYEDFDWYHLTNALYRVTLLRLHVKINEGFKNSFINYNNSDEPILPEFTDSIKWLGADFGIIYKLLSSVGYMKYGHDNFVPFLPHLKDEQRCDPINVRYTNLREIVSTLADPKTPMEIRKHFWEYNPIPGAKWSTAELDGKDEFVANTCLSNPDDIMPDKYERTELNEDIHCITSYIGLTERKNPKDIVNKRIDYDSHGSKAQFVSSIAIPVRCPSYNDKNLEKPVGDHDAFWTPRWLEQNEIDFGVFYLFGEHSEALKNERLMAIRFKEVATQRIHQSCMNFLLLSQ